MRKVIFTRTVKVARGDGSGPTYEAGKTYCVREDSYRYWIGEDAVVDAPADAVAVNEPPAPRREIKIVAAGKSRFNVVRDGAIVNEKPLKGGPAERLRQRLLAEPATANDAVAPPAAAPAPAPDPQSPQPITFQRVAASPGVPSRVYVLHPWPQATVIAKEMLAASDGLLSSDGEFVTVTVANGSARYRRYGEDDFDLKLHLVAATYTPAPPDLAAASEERKPA